MNRHTSTIDMSNTAFTSSDARTKQREGCCADDAAAPAPADVAPPADTATSSLATVREMIGEVVEHRELLWRLTQRNIRIRYKQAIMGFAWAIFMPMVIIGAGVVVKLVMAQIAGRDFQIASFAGMAVKAVPWAFFVGTLSFATTSLTGNISLVTKIYFPREVFPFSYVLTQVFDSSVGAAVMLLVLVVLGQSFSLHIMWAIPLVLALVMLATGAALLLSCGNLFFRDVKYLVQVAVTFGIFFTPVFYDAANLGPQGSVLMMLNPIAPILEGLRLAVVEHHNLLHSLATVSAAGETVIAWQPWYLLYSGAWALGSFGGAWFLFHKLELVYAEYV